MMPTDIRILTFEFWHSDFDSGHRRGLADLAGLGWNWLDLAGRFRRRPQLNNSQSVRATASAKSAALSTKNNRSRVGSITMMPISCRRGLRWPDARVSIAHAKLLSSRANTPLRTDCVRSSVLNIV